MHMGSFDSCQYGEKVIDKKNHVMEALEKIPNEKILKFNLELNLNNFQKEKERKDYK